MLELVDDGERRVLLEIVKQVPDLALLEACRLVRQLVLRDVLEEVVEDIVEGHEVEELRRVLVIGASDVLDDDICDILQSPFAVIPKRIEKPEVFCCRRRVQLVHEPIPHSAALAAEIGGGEALEWEINGRLSLRRLDEEIATPLAALLLRLESYLFPDPCRAFTRDCPLLEFVPQVQLELRAVEVPLAIQAWDVELSFCLFRFLLEERRRSEQEPQFLDVL